MMGSGDGRAMGSVKGSDKFKSMGSAMNESMENDALDAMLERAGSVPRPRGQFVESLRIRIHGEWRRERLVRRRWLAAGGVALAACLLMGVMLGTTVVDRQSSMAVLAVAALEEAETVHITTRQLRDGALAESKEAWYVQGVGTVSVGHTPEATQVRIDDGRSDLRFHDGDVAALTANGSAPTEAIADVLGVRWLDYDLRPWSEGDRWIDGQACSAYRLVSPSHQVRYEVWVDGERRVRRYERLVYGESGWVVDEEATVRYDVRPGGFRFFGELGDGADVLDTGRSLEERFSLSRARVSQRVGDAVVAVHELSRCDGGLLFVACSVRPVGDGVVDDDDVARFAERGLSASWVSSVGEGVCAYRGWRLAEVTAGQTHVFWYVLEPGDLCRDRSVDDGGAVELVLADDGGEGVSVVSLAYPKDELSLAYVVSRMYGDAAKGFGGGVGVKG